MVLDLIFTGFKRDRGYYINHDSLLAASEQSRQKLAFYFLAEQAPQKLEPALLQEYHSLRRTYEWPIKGLALVGLLWTQRSFWKVSTPVINRLGLDIAQGVLRVAVSFWLADRLGDCVAEPILVGSQKFERLAEKVPISIYDFQAAKRESVVTNLQKEISNENHSWLGIQQI